MAENNTGIWIYCDHVKALDGVLTSEELGALSRALDYYGVHREFPDMSKPVSVAAHLMALTIDDFGGC